MNKNTFKPNHYANFEDMRHSEHWHQIRVNECAQAGSLTEQESLTLWREFDECGMTTSLDYDQFYVHWHQFWDDYKRWRESGIAY